MKITDNNAISAAIAGGVVFSILSFFIVNQNSPQTYDTVRHQGVDILCDIERGSIKSYCVGEYGRGWPWTAGEGYVVRSSTGQNNLQFELKPANLIGNTFFWSSISFGVLWLWLRKNKA